MPRTITHVVGLCGAAFYTDTEYEDHTQFG